MMKQPKYERIGTLPIGDVVPLIKDKEVNRIEAFGYQVKTAGLRLATFAYKGTTCSCCQLEASFFAVESNNNAQSFHLNLWGVDQNGNEILFTHDHTLARGLGGKDHLSNCTTMCYNCNQKKSVLERKILKIVRTTNMVAA